MIVIIYSLHWVHVIRLVSLMQFFHMMYNEQKFKSLFKLLLLTMTEQLISQLNKPIENMYGFLYKASVPTSPAKFQGQNMPATEGGNFWEIHNNLGT